MSCNGAPFFMSFTDQLLFVFFSIAPFTISDVVGIKGVNNDAHASIAVSDVRSIAVALEPVSYTHLTLPTIE